MGEIPDVVLTRFRSPGKALYDLVERYRGLPFNDPGRAAIGRMIEQLAVEITRSVGEGGRR